MAKRTSKATTPALRRASQRLTIGIYLASVDLKNLMTEQCRVGGRYLTFYRGTKAELIEAGVPGEAFPASRQALDFEVQTLNVCCTGSSELLSGSMRRTDAGVFELEIDWGCVRPYIQGAHPVVAELARMILCDLTKWTDTLSSTVSNELTRPAQLLASDDRSDYKPRAGTVVRVTPAFYKILSEEGLRLYELVHSCCEVVTMEWPQEGAESQKPRLQLVTSVGKAVSHG